MGDVIKRLPIFHEVNIGSNTSCFLTGSHSHQQFSGFMDMTIGISFADSFIFDIGPLSKTLSRNYCIAIKAGFRFELLKADSFGQICDSHLESCLSFRFEQSAKVDPELVMIGIFPVFEQVGHAVENGDFIE